MWIWICEYVNVNRLWSSMYVGYIREFRCCIPSRWRRWAFSTEPDRVETLPCSGRAELESPYCRERRAPTTGTSSSLCCPGKERQSSWGRKFEWNDNGPSKTPWRILASYSVMWQEYKVLLMKFLFRNFSATILASNFSLATFFFYMYECSYL